jgi:hypothetical protein
VTALCCGGLPLFASIGLGAAAYSSLGLWRYVPVFLALGTLSFVAISWLVLPTEGSRCCLTGAAAPRDGRERCDRLGVHGGSAVLPGLAGAVVGTAERFAEGAHPEAPGAMNQGRLEALGVLPAGLVLLGVLPFKISQRR